MEKREEVKGEGAGEDDGGRESQEGCWSMEVKGVKAVSIGRD